MKLGRSYEIRELYMVGCCHALSENLKSMSQHISLCTGDFLSLSTIRDDYLSCVSNYRNTTLQSSIFMVTYTHIFFYYCLNKLLFIFLLQFLNIL